MKRVYVAGPYRGRNPFEVSRNIRAAADTRDQVLLSGALPITPHLLTGGCDGVIPEQQLLDALIELMKTCHEVRLVADWVHSAGTRAEIRAAFAAGIPVFEPDEDGGGLLDEGLFASICKSYGYGAEAA